MTLILIKYNSLFKERVLNNLRLYQMLSIFLKGVIVYIQFNKIVYINCIYLRFMIVDKKYKNISNI